ncbi:hypothetical protein DBIPINDM_006314 [Mesorhizobium sp. AR02]|uniref:DUF6252 family protein n=1 Tax=Mesorhizobium sp. AR02 TaxID=2865837 RepID=UPI00215EBABC|nr:DUF6252 family protein [Mesorhizobium sp. AR02]UVK52878.1 hypothetical protein DBIPINDM_006314 [Mesorhizobium sp. AR02]
MLTGLRSASCLLLCLTALASPQLAAKAEDAVMTASFDSKPWTASFAQGTTLEMAGKPVLNLSGTQQGSPTMTFNSMLVLKTSGDYVGTYKFGGGFPANGGNFNILESGAMVSNVRFKSGEVVINRYDPAAKAVSGHFSASGKDDDGKETDIKDGTFSRILVSPQ